MIKQMETVKSLEQVPAAFTKLFAMVGNLEQLIKSAPQAPAQNDLLNIDEAANHIHLAKSTLYDMVSRKEVPHFKKRGRLYFSKADLTAWVRSGEVKTKAEISGEANNYIKKGGKHV